MNATTFPACVTVLVYCDVATYPLEWFRELLSEMGHTIEVSISYTGEQPVLFGCQASIEDAVEFLRAEGFDLEYLD